MRRLTTKIFFGVVAVLLTSGLVWAALTLAPGPKRRARQRPIPGLKADSALWSRTTKPVSDMAADSQGNVYLALVVPDKLASLVKYNAAGARLWARRPFGISFRWSVGRTKIIEYDGRFYLFGARAPGDRPLPSRYFGDLESALAAFEPDGQGNLVLTQDGSAERFTLDDSGRAYLITSISKGAGGPSYGHFRVISGYDREGKRAWTVESPADDPVRQSADFTTAFDGAGRVYQLRTGNDGKGKRINELVQLQDGQERWTINPPDDSNIMTPRLLAAADSVYLILNIKNEFSGADAARVIKYNNEGRVLWTKDLPSSVVDKVILAAGNLYIVTGIYEASPNDPADQSYHILSIKLDSDGNVQWEKRSLRVRDRWLELRDAQVDSAGNLYTAVRSSRHSESEPDTVRRHDLVLITKQGADGKVEWERKIAPKISFNGEPVILLALDGRDGLYVGGSYVSAVDQANNLPDIEGFLIKYKR